MCRGRRRRQMGCPQVHGEHSRLSWILLRRRPQRAADCTLQTPRPGSPAQNSRGGGDSVVPFIIIILIPGLVLPFVWRERERVELRIGRRVQRPWREELLGSGRLGLLNPGG